MAKLPHAGRFAAALEQAVACGAFGQGRFARPVVEPVGGIAIQAIGTRPTDVTVHALLASDAADQARLARVEIVAFLSESRAGRAGSHAA